MYENKETDWLSKEKRELFSKTVNSIIMNLKASKTGELIQVEEIAKVAKKIVDSAFKFYPDKNEPELGVDNSEAIEKWQKQYNEDCEKAEIENNLNEVVEKLPIIQE